MIGLRAESAQHGRFVERCRREIAGVDAHTVFAVADTLIVRHHDVNVARLNFLHRGDVLQRHSEVLLRLCQKFDDDALRAYDESLAAFVLDDDTQYFELRDGLLHTERAEDCTTAAAHSPFDRVFHMRIERLRQLRFVEVESCLMANRHFLFQKINVVCHNLILLFYALFSIFSVSMWDLSTDDPKARQRAFPCVLRASFVSDRLSACLSLPVNDSLPTWRECS